MSSLDFLDAASQAQLQSFIQNTLQEGLRLSKQRLAESEAARDQQAAQLQELRNTIPYNLSEFAIRGVFRFDESM
ncbi:hypothetical protein E4U19_008035, partial [Claviceps sp. Clav32 group G5]